MDNQAEELIRRIDALPDPSADSGHKSKPRKIGEPRSTGQPSRTTELSNRARVWMIKEANVADRSLSGWLETGRVAANGRAWDPESVDDPDGDEKRRLEEERNVAGPSSDGPRSAKRFKIMHVPNTKAAEQLEKSLGGKSFSDAMFGGAETSSEGE
jgi:hypothetical protein